MSKRKAFLVGLGAAAMLNMTSCKSGDSNKENENTDDIETVDERLRNEDQEYYNAARDSLLKEYGYDRNIVYDTEVSIDSLKIKLEKINQNKKWYELQNKVEKEIANVGKKYEAQIKNIFENYHLPINEKASKDIAVFCDYDEYSNWAESKYCYDSAGRGLFSSDFSEKIGIESYGSERQQEIKDAVSKVVKIMRNEQDTKRLAIAKTYADYYPELDTSCLPAEYAKLPFDDAFFTMHEAGYYTGYDHLTNEALVVMREVSVYDSNLPVDFFNENGAKYQLKNIKKGEWQVEKIKDGKISRTPVFKDNVEYNTYISVRRHEIDEPKSHFEYELGKNMGVRISVSEVLFAKQAKNDKNLSDEELALVTAPIKAELKRLEEIQRTHYSKENRAYHEADSLLQLRQAKREKQSEK